MNKIRSEVDTDAEVIIGAITDSELEGKIRVSIVATSLDGQQPESKSVVNMVHRIHKRNPGYSDFSNLGSSSSFNFSNNNTSPVSHGANALKLENEVVSEEINNTTTNQTVEQVNNQYHEELLRNQEIENIVENTSSEEEKSFSQEVINGSEIKDKISNDLKEFGVDVDEPDLFSSDHNSDSENFLNSSQDEEDDLEIPAFLRRQKN